MTQNQDQASKIVKRLVWIAAVGAVALMLAPSASAYSIVSTGPGSGSGAPPAAVCVQNSGQNVNCTYVDTNTNLCIGITDSSNRCTGVKTYG